MDEKILEPRLKFSLAKLHENHKSRVAVIKNDEKRSFPENCCWLGLAGRFLGFTSWPCCFQFHIWACEFLLADTHNVLIIVVGEVTRRELEVETTVYYTKRRLNTVAVRNEISNRIICVFICI